jgi:hypothetical protein
LDKGDHPELDTTEELPADGIKQYQSLIGALQWAVSLCHFDIHCSVMTMGRFRAAPCSGHLERVKRICGYLCKYPDTALCFRVGILDHPSYYITPMVRDWEHTVYGNVEEELPHDAPIPRGYPVRITSFINANLQHDLTTGCAAMGIIHLLNKTPIEWFCKCQNTVETATYRSEFVAARAATEQIMDM